MPDPTDFRVVNIARCARCGQDHNYVRFERLSCPPDDWRWEYWALCPMGEGPIFMNVMGSDEHATV